MRNGSKFKRLAAMMMAAAMMTQPVMAAGIPKTLPEPGGNVRVPDKPTGAHWVWIGDYGYGNYGRSILYDADTAQILGMIDTGWEGAALAFSGNEIYNAAMFMSRGFRGTRTDVVTTFDAKTLKPLREVQVPAKTIRGFQDLNHFTLTDDQKFMLLQMVTPASSVGVVDIKENKFVGEVETAGCMNAMPTGNRSFFAICGDGSALSITLGDDGKEVSRKRFPKFFDPDADPIHESGIRSGNIWRFVSHRGVIHTVDVSKPDFKFQPVWTVAEKAGDKTWIPGQPMQTLAVHHKTQRLYVLMHESDLKPKLNGIDFHRQAGTEVRVFDLKTKKLLQRISLKNLTDAIAVSQDDAPLLYASSLYHLAVTIQDVATGAIKHELPFPSFPHVVQPVD